MASSTLIQIGRTRSSAAADRPALDTESWVGYALVIGYVALAVSGLVWGRLPAVFWTMLLPVLPIGIVLMGFARWRRICPLANLAEIGRRLNRGEQRKVPAWLQRRVFVVTFAGLLAMLVLRLVATNGDSRWLGALLLGIALVAVVVNWRYTGKSWCNYVCPVGLVERIYTEPGPLVGAKSSSICASCTACKRNCPDIDQENGYWRELLDPGRRIATYAFPGLVLSFYVYYWLRAGEWAAYFDGRWTRSAFSLHSLLGPGFFFAPQVPAVVAATVTLVLFSAASWAAFSGIERMAARRGLDPERRRHLVLTAAAFTAFCAFYLFAGAPTLRRIPGATMAVGLVAPTVATLFTAKRWRRSREEWELERAAPRLRRAWSFGHAPPDDARVLHAWAEAGGEMRERQLHAWSEAVRAIASGPVSRRGVLALNDVRERLGITDSERDIVLTGLSVNQRRRLDEATSRRRSTRERAAVATKNESEGSRVRRAS